MEKSQYEESCSLDTYRVDRNEIGKPSGLWQLMQEAASNQMATQKPSYTDLVDAGKALMLARVDLAIPEQIGLKEALVSSSWPCPSTRATFFRNYTLQRGTETVAFAATQWSLVDLASRKILKVEDVDFSNYWYGTYRELLKDKFRIDKETLAAMQTVGQKEVRYSDLDYNGHMNNTYYLDVLCDYVPELATGTHRVSFARVHYSKEAPLGDVLTILRSDAILLSESDAAQYGVPADCKYIFRTLKADGEMNIQGELVLCPVVRG